MAWLRRPLSLLALVVFIDACGRTVIDPGTPAVDGRAPGLVVPLDGPAQGDDAGPGGSRGRDSAADSSSPGGTSGSRDAAPVRDAAAAMLTVLPVRATIPTAAPVQFNAYIVRGASAEDVTTRATWSVDDGGLATITSGATGGRLTATKAGSATVRAWHMGMDGNTTVKIVDTGITTSAMRPNQAMINLDMVQTFRITATFSDGAMVDVTDWAQWRSLDEKVATTSNAPSMRGVARGIGVGNTTIVASFAGTEAMATLSVRAASRLTSIAVTPMTASTMVGETFTFTAVGSYSDGTMRDLTGSATWSSSNGAIAQVTFGRARCLASGMATITVSTMGQSATGTIRCGLATVTGVRLTPSDSTTTTGSRVQFSATAFFMDGTSRDVSTQTTFASSNTNVATFGTTTATRAVVTAVAAGMTMISGTYSGVTGTTSLTVR